MDKCFGVFTAHSGSYAESHRAKQLQSIGNQYETGFHLSGAVLREASNSGKQKNRISLIGLIRMDFVTKRYCVYSGILYRSYPLFATFTMMRSSSVMMILE